MRKELIPYFMCPFCKRRLKFSGLDNIEEIIEGKFFCIYCSNEYPLYNGVPFFYKPQIRFLLAAKHAIEKRLSEIKAHFNYYPSRMKKADGIFISEIIPYIVKDKGPIIDIGTGMGDLFFKLCLSVKKRLFVGVDIDGNVLLALQKYLKEKAVDNFASFAVADAYKLPFFDRISNCIISHLIFLNIDDANSVTQEIYRLLSRNGYFIFSHFLCKKNSKSDRVLSKSSRRGMFSLGKVEMILRKNKFKIKLVKQIFSGIHEGFPFDGLLPIPGDYFKGIVIIARK